MQDQYIYILWKSDFGAARGLLDYLMWCHLSQPWAETKETLDGFIILH